MWGFLGSRDKIELWPRVPPAAVALAFRCAWSRRPPKEDAPDFGMVIDVLFSGEAHILAT